MIKLYQSTSKESNLSDENEGIHEETLKSKKEGTEAVCTKVICTGWPVRTGKWVGT